MKDSAPTTFSPLKVPFFYFLLGEAEKKDVCDVIDSLWLTTGIVTKIYD